MIIIGEICVNLERCLQTWKDGGFESMRRIILLLWKNRHERDEHSKKFRQWAADQIGAEGLALNPASATQLATFLFGGSLNSKTKQPTEAVRVFKVAREEIPDDALQAFKKAKEEQTKQSPAEGMSLRAIVCCS